jgi:pimeloyl-ACP methyl ester carboxylesterase
VSAPVVFVHGVPETAALWDAVRSAINRESIALSMPGFGCARPAGFTATKDAYADWLVAELDVIGAPVDLVGHDWGGILTVRVATAFGNRLRSWATDAANIFHKAYEWHDIAKVWQTPGDGEAAQAAFRALPGDQATAMLAAGGIPVEHALAMWQATDEVMDGCILDLYRSAVPNAHRDWGAAVAQTNVPGLVLLATDDPFGHEELATDMAVRLAASTARLEGLGHFWPLQDPARGAKVLERFWTTLD